MQSCPLDLFSLISFALDVTPWIILLWGRLRRFIVRKVILFVKPELLEIIKPIILECIQEYEEQENKKSNEKAASVLTKLRRLFKS